MCRSCMVLQVLQVRQRGAIAASGLPSSRTGTIGDDVDLDCAPVFWLNTQVPAIVVKLKIKH